MSPHHAAPIRTLVAFLCLLAFVACKNGGGSDDFCEEICSHIQDQCEPDGFDVRTDCEEHCKTELRSREFVQGEDVCIECCLDVILPDNKCTDVLTDCQDSGNTNAAQNDRCVIGDNAADMPDDDCERRYGFSICLDDPTVCGEECEDQLLDQPIMECGP